MTSSIAVSYPAAWEATYPFVTGSPARFQAVIPPRTLIAVTPWPRALAQAAAERWPVRR